MFSLMGEILGTSDFCFSILRLPIGRSSLPNDDFPFKNSSCCINSNSTSGCCLFSMLDSSKDYSVGKVSYWKVVFCVEWSPRNSKSFTFHIGIASVLCPSIFFPWFLDIPCLDLPANPPFSFIIFIKGIFDLDALLKSSRTSGLSWTWEMVIFEIYYAGLGLIPLTM